VAWQFATGGPVRSTPILADGVIYATSNDGNLYALDAISGAEKWRMPLGQGSRSTPTVDAGVVYVGGNDRYLYAVDAVTGEVRWRFETISRLVSSPTVSGDTVYVGGTDQVLFAIATDTGLERWHSLVLEDFITSPTIVGNLVVVGNSGMTSETSERAKEEDTIGQLVALDARTGAYLWTLPDVEDKDAAPSPTVEGGVEAVATVAVDTNVVVVVNTVPEDGASTDITATTNEGLKRDENVNSDANYLAGKKVKISYFAAPAAYVNGVIYSSSMFVGAESGRIGGLLTATDPATGESVGEWGFATLNPVLSSPTVANNMAYVGTQEGYLYAVDLETGIERWGFAAQDQVFASASVAGDTVYVATMDGSIYALDAATGVTRWTYKTDGAIWSAVTVANGFVYAGSDDGTIYAIGGA
jgi:outer membrane protein assembly factor BamB